MSETNALVDCPFCGGKAAWGEGEQKTKYGNEQVYCTDCMASAPPDGSKAEAAYWWNARAASVSEDRWTPVSERLPKSGSYLVTCVGNFVEEATFVEGKWYDVNDDEIVLAPPIAYMPLPEPYQPKDEIEGEGK